MVNAEHRLQTNTVCVPLNASTELWLATPSFNEDSRKFAKVFREARPCFDLGVVECFCNT